MYFKSIQVLCSISYIFQSDIASEKPGVLDCLKEGVCRLFKWGTPHSSRLLPIWQLVIPTAVYGVSVYIISSLVQSVVHWFITMKRRSQLERVTLFKFFFYTRTQKKKTC